MNKLIIYSMRKITERMIYFIAVILFFSCSPEETTIFDDSSANRIDAALENYQKILTDSKNGWLMEYYPASDQAYGGYNLLLSFKDDKVTIAGESGETDETSTSFYGLKQSSGPVLTVNTYNPLFHFFSTPDSKVPGVGKDGIGMDGDFEFLILKATPDSVILKGKKTSNKIVMTSLKEGFSWTDYLQKIEDAAEDMTFTGFEYQINNKSIPVSVSHRTLHFTYTNDAGNEVSEVASYIQTATGYKLYKPLIIDGVTVEEFKYVKEGETEYFSPVNGASAKLVVVYPPINEVLINGDWYFKYSGMGPFGKQYWDYTKTNGLDPMGEELYYAYMGKYSDGRYGFCFGSFLPGTGVYIGALLYNYQLVGEDKVTYTFGGQGADNGAYYFQNAKFNYLINPVSLQDPRTFTLTTDNNKKPSWIKLTDNSNSNNTIVLESVEILLPFDR
ncbi:MAG TPA: hypothetical protein DDW85_10695 [Porphyromonadaceae bacterium]|nr:hypothetical protein [Porphyromonadaceae bacterium]